jgi:mersacidin/lichenicidin family type 2 lantibiotic
MTIDEIVRAWKDEEYRNSLTPEQRLALLPNPAGVVELEDEALEEAAGGFPIHTILCISFWCITYRCTIL